MKDETIKSEDFDNYLKANPKQIKGHWKKLLEDTHVNGNIHKVTGLKKGQVSAAQRQCKDFSDIEFVSIEKGTGFMIRRIKQAVESAKKAGKSGFFS